jgi:hypothetical protein
VWGCALAAVTAGTGTARAAWDNVFQTCCWGCNKPAPAVVRYYDPPAPCPQPCTTRYVQRSYYQPVTTYRTETYYEPVTTYKTSYYYEPVTSYRYSMYYDPCTGCPQQVATPVTAYRLRSQCCPVTSYLARTACKPVTGYQIAYYWEPQTTCCQTTIGAPIFAQPTPAAPPPVGESAPPSAGDTGGYPPPPSSDGSRRYYEPPIMPRAGDTNSYRQPPLGAPQVLPPAAPPEPAKVRLDKIVAVPRDNVHGALVGTNQAPQPNRRVLFVNADRERTQEEVLTDGAGRFCASLVSGNWLVYTSGADGRPVFHRKLEVRDAEAVSLTLANQ